MKRQLRRWTAILAAALWLVSVTPDVPAQESAPQSQQTPPAESMPQESAEPLTPAQLDQLTAPVALYSDPLLGMVMTAATYPLEVVEAARWLDEDDHESLKGEALQAALEQENWDTSVKALVAAPEVLRMMDQNVRWTEQLGNAFLSQQSDVMDSIQRLRQRAAASGALQSNPQSSVSNEDGEIVIEPVSPQVIYVPCYGPAIYGPWPWPAYPPFYFPYPSGYCYGAGLITFGIGLSIISPYWGWGRWNWRGHGFYVRGPQRSRGGPIPEHPWRHNPQHRRGVAYPDMTTARRHLGPNARRPLTRPRRAPISPRYTPQRPSATQGGPRESPQRAAPQRAAPQRAAPQRAAPQRVAPATRSSGGHGGRGRAGPERAAGDHHEGRRPPT